jgi:hypothetical protein
MPCIDCSTDIQTIGSNPARINWKVVRGDTSRLRFEFLENDESSSYDTTGWTYISTAYNKNTQDSYTLEVIPSEGYVDIVASAEMTSDWGQIRTGTAAELDFDLQVTFDDDTVWTPVVGVITVTADITLHEGV